MANTFSQATPKGELPRNQNNNDDDVFVDQKDRVPILGFFQKLIQYIVSFTVGMLFLWFVLALFGADPEHPFVKVVYTVTDPLITPFRGLFGLEANVGASRFELEALVAIIVYTLLGVAIYKFINLFRQDQNGNNKYNF